MLPCLKLWKEKRFSQTILLQVDIIEAEKLNSIVKDFMPDKIFHLAAESHVDRSITGPQEFLNTNILGTFNILESIRKILIIFQKILFSSMYQLMKCLEA